MKEEMEFDDRDEHEEEEVGGTLPVPPPPPLPPVPASYEALANNNSNSSARAKKLEGGRYRECLKNHAVGIGGNAVDGCGEFMPAGEEGTLDGLKCAACGCHRNFHRKELDGVGDQLGFLHPHHQFTSPYYRTPAAGYIHLAPPHIRASPALALPSTSGGGAAHSHEELEDDVSNPSGSGGGGGGGSVGKKRHRTKFTPEQKEKMLAFAERVGWRIQKHDEAAVQQFCTDACVSRHVLKVWMHNNKHTLGKKP